MIIQKKKKKNHNPDKAKVRCPKKQQLPTMHRTFCNVIWN